MAEAHWPWVGYIEIRGLYAAVHRGQRGGIDPQTPLVVLRDGVAVDGCPRAYRLGLRPGMPRREVLHHVPGATLANFDEAEYGPAGRALWSACARYGPLVEPSGPHRVFVGLTAPAAAPPREAMASLLRHAVRAVARAADVPPAEIEGMAGLARSKLVARAALQAAGVGRPDLWGQAERDEEARRRLAEAVAAGGERFPVRALRRGIPVTGIELRREHMLHLYHPMRWTPGERATGERAAR